jgi:peptidoglycan/xylan/chitin deacetylase (PgdA/CDA1 family)
LKNSSLVISLDFELHWGVFDTYGESYNDNILGARIAIPKILALFKKYNIHATWAVVGFLFNEDKNDHAKYNPLLKPSYSNKKLRSYDCNIGENEASDKLHYAHSIIKLIQECPNQELASHSYSHYYCQAKGQTIAEFDNDIKSAINIAKDKFGVDLKSFVFPKNEVNYEYLEVLKKYSFSIYRDSSPVRFKWVSFDRVFRLMNTFLKLSKYSINAIIDHHGLKAIKGDRFLRPYTFSFLNYLMLRRVKNEMTFAAKNNSIYHLWWHPHNFGKNLDKNLENLEDILKEFTSLGKIFNMKSFCMKDL